MTSAIGDKAGRLLRRSPLEQDHLERGATFVEFAGWQLPLRFVGEVVEHRAVRESAGLFDISHMGQVTISGPDAAVAIARAVVSDVTVLDPLAARYTMMCDPDGGVLDDLIVYRLADEEFLVIANAANTSVVVEALIAGADGLRATVTDRTAGQVLLSIQGPRAAQQLAPHIEPGDTLPSRFHLIKTTVAGRAALVTRTGYTGEDGFEISTAAADGEVVWRALLEDGSVVPAGLAARDSLRLEAGLALYGHELDVAHTPFDANFARIVDFDHAFVGREALEPLRGTGVATPLVGLLCERQRSPRPGYEVRAASGETVGIVTSGGPSITLGRAIAMAYVERAAASIGTPLEIDIRGRSEPARVVGLPFVRRAAVRRAAPAREGQATR
jgi:aminomethyltransferase